MYAFHLTADAADDDLDAAKANREAVEAGLRNGNAEGDFPGAIDLPPGRLALDRAVLLTPAHGGATLRGAGPGRSSLANLHAASPYWSNQTLAGLGEGLGYELAADGHPWAYTKDPATITVTDPSPLPVGRVAYFWRWAAYGDTGAVRRQVARLDGDRVTFDGPIPAGLNAAKRVDGWPLWVAGEGATRGSVSAADARLAAGQLVFVTDGPALANEAVGEFRIIAEDGAVVFGRPLRRAYAHPTLCPIDAVRGVTVEDLTLDQPPHPEAECGSFKYAHGLTLRGVHAPGNVALTGCADVAIEDCRFGRLSLNSCHDVRVRGCHFGDVYLEEGCFDCTFGGIAVGPAPVNGVSTTVGCERLTFRDVTVYGAGTYPVAVEGRECVLEGVSSHGPGECYVGGDGVRVSGWWSAGRLVMHAGREQLVLGAHAPAVYLGWFDGAGAPLPDTGGRAYGIVGAVKGNLRDEGGDWPDPGKWVVT